MARLSYSRQALTDLLRIADFLQTVEPELAGPTLDLIDEAISMLARHPQIGRPVEQDLRELVISHGKSGYVALYSYEPVFDAVLVLALRHQREAGFRA